MPFESQAQRKKFYAMYNRGEISKATLDKWEAETPKGKKLPERVKNTKKKKSKSSKVSAKRTKTKPRSSQKTRKKR